MPALTATPTAHIRLDEQGRARIDDTGYKVIILAKFHVFWGWNAKVIHENFPDLSLGSWILDLEVLALCGEPEDLLGRGERLPLR